MSRKYFRSDRAKCMIPSKESMFSVLKTGGDPPEKVSEGSRYHGGDQGNANTSYRYIFYSNSPPTLTRELCETEVFCVYSPALGNKPRYQSFHSRRQEAKPEQKFVATDGGRSCFEPRSLCMCRTGLETGKESIQHSHCFDNSPGDQRDPFPFFRTY